MQQDNSAQGGGLDERSRQGAAAENDDGHRTRDQAEGGGDDTEFSDEHPLASPGELAGTAGEAIAAEIAALGPADGSLADAQSGQGGGPATNTMGDAIGAGAGMDVGAGSPPDHSGAGGGEPIGQQGYAAPTTSRSPGGDGRA